MLTTLLETIRDWVLSLIAELTPHGTMPTIENLFAMPNNTIFETRGFYSSDDGNGGRYKITTSPTRGSRKLTLNGNVRYLCYLNNNKADYIDVCKLGVRAYPSNQAINFGTITKENSFATLNSTVLSEIYNNDTTEGHIPDYGAIFRFPVGRFVFENTIRLTKTGYSIKGETIPNVFNPDRITQSNNTSGTELIFPFLENGQTGILIDSGSAENITVLGNTQKYNISFDRAKTYTAPSEIVTETITDDNGTPFKTYGIKTSDQGIIHNVWVSGFYSGISCNEGDADNRMILDVFITNCHFGVAVGGDVKCKGIYEWNVHTALKMERALVSVIQLRADNCVNGIYMNDVSMSSVCDVDIDYCTENAIITDGNTMRNRFENIRSRCCTAKTYILNTDTAPDIRQISNTTGYGLIRVLSGYFRDNFISVVNNGVNPTDAGRNYYNSNYRVPKVLLTYANTISAIDKNVFSVPSFIIGSDEDVLKYIQTRNINNCIIHSTIDTYYMEGSTVKSTKAIFNAT